jgi:AAA domain
MKDQNKAQQAFDPKSLKELLKLPWEERLEIFRAYKTPHTRLSTVANEVRRVIRLRGSKGFILIVGPTRIGKTTLIEGIVDSMLREAMDEMLNDPGFIPVAGIEAYAYGRGYNWSDHWVSCLEAVNEPLIEHKTSYGEMRFEQVWPSHAALRSGKSDVMRRCFERAAKLRRVRLFWIDEANHLTLVPNPKMLRPHLEIIKSVANRSKAMHALFGSYDLLNLRNASGQLGSRAVTIHFSRYRTDNDEDLKSFADAALSLVFRMILPVPVELKNEDLDYCLDISLGIIGLLKVWLTDAFGAVLENGRKMLTRKDLESHQPPIDVLNKISLEIERGEGKLLQDEKLLGDIKLRMGKPPTAHRVLISSPEPDEMTVEPPGEAGDDTEKESQSEKGRPQQRRSKKRNVSDRNPKRDKTGEGRKKRAA